MNSSSNLNRPATWAGAALALAAIIAFAMPTQAAALCDQATVTLRDHLCERFCGHHHHHHGHQWCNGHEDFWYPGH